MSKIFMNKHIAEQSPWFEQQLGKVCRQSEIGHERAVDRHHAELTEDPQHKDQDE